MGRPTCQSVCLITALLLGIFCCTRPPLPPPVVLFDQGHGQQSLIEDSKKLGLSQLANIFRDHNFEVRSSHGPLTKELLRDVSTLVISGPTSVIAEQEVQAVLNYLNDGGQLCIMITKMIFMILI